LWSASRDPRHLPPFPTRRSSDLASIALDGRAARFRPSQESQAMDFDTRSRDTATASGSSAARPEASSGRIGVLLLNLGTPDGTEDRKSTRLNSSHVKISYAVFCL